jgi:hypothetical protein
MKTLLFIALAGTAWADNFPEIQPPPLQPPPPVYLAPAAKNTNAPKMSAVVYEQKPQGVQPLVQPQQAQAIITRFKEALPKLGNPRFLVYINRELIYAKAGAKLSEQKEALPLADRQTLRDIERLFGRPLRAAGATLADQEAAAQILGGKSIKTIAGDAGGEKGATDRQTIAQFAEVVIEVLISAKTVTVPEVSGGDRNYQTPDIQATAIRLSDAKILGQASSADLLRTPAISAYIARNYNVNEITEAAALMLMEDMLTSAK